jgi:small subunit ribosomal protein S6
VSDACLPVLRAIFLFPFVLKVEVRSQCIVATLPTQDTSTREVTLRGHHSRGIIMRFLFFVLPASGVSRLFTAAAIVSGSRIRYLEQRIDRGKEVKQLAEENITPTGAVSADATDDTTTDVADDVATDDVATDDATTGDAADGDATDDDVADDANGSQDDGAQDNSPVGTVVVPQPELNDALSSSGDEDAPRREVEGGRSYEIIFITRAGDPDATDAATNRLREQIEDNGGAVDNVRTSETRRLAYPISKEIEGIYTVVNARFLTNRIAEIDRFFKLEEAVLRHMILKQEQ